MCKKLFYMIHYDTFYHTFVKKYLLMSTYFIIKKFYNYVDK